MIFTETKLKGSYLIDIERLPDERGFFARSWCQNEFLAQGLISELVQCSVSFNAKKGTLRGMHYQIKPHEEAKLVRCTMGSIYDVIVDMRQNSLTFGQHVGAVLSANNRKMLYVPEGFAHGFLTLEDNTEVFYQMSEFYAPEYSKGFRWNDSLFNINWPADLNVISERDRQLPDFISLAGVKT
ncbi:dTDP-4-dehydrorhamnose 3,5-epimerase [Crenothrix sp.]|uniref:dTDP-4-dehydrorhamnose 3,5-epimerase n=1 Tax=Crenothrix sp. TaxID=3100433 RepID=UPI00374C9A95